MIFGGVIFGILVGLFVIPPMMADPAGTIETIANIIGKVVEVASYIGGVGEVLS